MSLLARHPANACRSRLYCHHLIEWSTEFMECEEKRKTLVSVICEYERASTKERILQIKDAPFNTHSIYASTRGKLT
jgi:hypothetical protein